MARTPPQVTTTVRVIKNVLFTIFIDNELKQGIIAECEKS